VPAGECDARPESVVPWSGAEELGASVAVTTRDGGVSTGPYRSLNLGLHVGDDPGSVVENRRRAAGSFGARLDEVVFAEQVHGAAVAVVGNDDRGRGTTSLEGAVEATDALVTATPGLTLAILVADCVPIALLDPEARVLAAVHAGWRGTAAGAAEAALRAMCALGARPERTVAFLGPAVHPDRYQVGDEVTRALAPDGTDPGVARPDGPGRWLIDLGAVNRRRLVAAGLDPDRIVDAGASTADAEYFSDRAARPCGRFALLARLVP
jgi:YfiH family protein